MGNRKEGGRFPGKPWIIAGTVQLLIAGVLVYLVFVSDIPVKGSIETLFNTHGRELISAVGVLVVLTAALLILAGIIGSKKPPEVLQRFSDATGIRFVRKFGVDGAGNEMQPGVFYQASYGQWTLRFSLVTDHDYLGTAYRLSLFHPRPLGMGLLCKVEFYDTRWPRFHQMREEYRRLTARKVDLADHEVKCWAVKRREAAELLSDARVLHALDELKILVKQRHGSVILNDRYVLLLVNDEAVLSRDTVDRMGAFLGAISRGMPA